MDPGPRTCAVCDAPLSLHDGGDRPVCADARCRWQYDQTPRHCLCEGCGRFLAPHELGGRWCGRLGCQQAREHWKAEQERRDRAALEERGRRFRDAVAWAAGVADPAAYRLILVPSITAPLTPVPDYRRDEMAGYLRAAFAEAAAGPEDGPPVSPEPPAPGHRADAVLGRACATCRGHCCRLGGVNHAFLTVATIRRVLRTFPDRPAEELIQGYLGAIGESLDGSCVYHGAAGCVLPRELRGDMCNTYFCAPLLAFRDGVPAEGPVRAFILSIAEGVRGEFTDGTEHRPLPPGPGWDEVRPSGEGP